MINTIHFGGYKQDRQRETKTLFKRLDQISGNKTLTSLRKVKAKLQVLSLYKKSNKESLTKLY